MRTLALALAAALSLSPAGATPVVPDAATAAEAPPVGPDPLAAGAALVPGLLVGGAGHFVAGDLAAAQRLFWWKTGGFAVLAAGSLALGASGASRKITPLAVPAMVVGFGTFGGATLADLIGVSTGGLSGAPRRDLPALAVSLGWRGVEDPQFAYRHLSALAVEGRAGRLGLALTAHLALDDDHWQARQRLAWRLLGPVRDRQVGDLLDLYGATAWQRFGSEGFSVLTVEGGLLGRKDLAGLSRSLRGIFAEGGIGWALEFYDFDGLGQGLGEDVFDLLTVRVGLGAWLGDGRGEVVLYYDHRRDGYAGGLSGEGIGVGFLGHLGLEGAFAVLPYWDVVADLQVGSAWVGGLALRRRIGGSP